MNTSTSQQSLVRILYHSKLSSREHLVGGIADIVRVGRAFTSANRISGILLFDGDLFCEYLEGPPAPMHTLLTRIRNDKRHIEMKVLLEGPLPEQRRRFTSWSLAYVDEDEQALIPSISELEGEACLHKLQEAAQKLLCL